MAARAEFRKQSTALRRFRLVKASALFFRGSSPLLLSRLHYSDVGVGVSMGPEYPCAGRAPSLKDDNLNLFDVRVQFDPVAFQRSASAGADRAKRIIDRAAAGQYDIEAINISRRFNWTRRTIESSFPLCCAAVIAPWGL